MRSSLPVFILLLILATVYGLTLAPGVTWANQGADSGDLVSAAWLGGVAHPPGYPLYLGLAWLAQRVLPGEVALRSNLLSAFFALLAALGLYAWLRRLAVSPSLAGLAALSLGLAPLVWSQAVISEVYTLQLFLSTLALMQFSWGSGWFASDLLRGVTFGLALANHPTSLFLAPVLLFDSNSPKATQDDPRARLLLRFAVAAVFALTLYASLLLRGMGESPVNWGRVNSFERLLWVMRGGSYASYLTPSASLGDKLPDLLGLLTATGWPLVLLAGLSLALLKGQATLKRLSLVLLALHLVFGLSYATRDWQVNLLPLFLLMAFWLGLGLARLPGQLWPQRAGVLRWALAGLVCLSLAFATLRAWPLVDASRDRRAAEFAETILGQAPPDSLIFTNEDRDTFALWYYHYVLGWRPDVAVMPIGMLDYDWQREVLRVAYPELVVPEQAEYNYRQAIIQANPARPVCAIFVEPQTAFLCK